eukprot:gene16722-8175_t
MLQIGYIVSHLKLFVLLLTLKQQSLLLNAISVEDQCLNSPCLNGGFCRTVSDGFVCTCVNGFIGLRCEKRSDECPLIESIKCINGHCRRDSHGTPKCECNANFGGKFCDQSLNTCEHTTCNGGSCLDSSTGYKCTCPSGSIGKNCQINPTKTIQCLESCQDNVPGSLGRKCWHNQSETIKVGWGYKQPLCSTRESCFDVSNRSTDFIEVQLKPIQVQPDDTLVFLTDVDAALYNDQFVPHIIPVEASSSDAFTACNTSNAIPLANYSWGAPGEMKVNASFLHLGTQYFIANVNSLHRCEFGLRLNVSVKENHCFDPLKPGAEMCNGHGNCLTDFSKKAYECNCCEGYAGQYCQDEDPCYIAPCKNNGVCNIVKDTDGKTTFRCKCAEGFLGFDCSRTVDHCESSPCLNEGTCSSKSNAFNCTCINGYFGSRNFSECSCGIGFAGQHCEINLSLCQNSIFCLDDTSLGCIDHGNSVTCRCSDGYTGSNCGVNKDDCVSNPCLNGGKCIDKVNGFQCLCSKGTKGEMCEVLDLTTTKPVYTDVKSKHVTTKNAQTQTSPQDLVLVTLDLKIVTDSCAKLQVSIEISSDFLFDGAAAASKDERKEESKLVIFSRSVLESLRDACKCVLSLRSSSIECKDELNGRFVTKLVVKSREEAKKAICSFNEKIKQGSLPTSDKNTYIVGINLDVSSCSKKKNDVDDKKPVHVEKSVFDKDKRTGIIIGSVAAVVIIIASCLILSVKFRNRQVHQAKGDEVKTYLNLVYQSDLDLIAPKSAWSTPEQTPELERTHLKYAIKKPSKRIQESSFSFENPGGETSSV